MFHITESAHYIIDFLILFSVKDRDKPLLSHGKNSFKSKLFFACMSELIVF